MNKSISYLYMVLSLVILLASCSEMNDKHDEYLAEGERIYIGKIDSLKTFAGDGRIKLRFWVSDPRAKTVNFYWFPNNDSVTVDINTTSAVDSFEVFIGGPTSTKSIQEGNYTLRAITRDQSNHFSIPFEKTINIYGDRFRSILTNRVLRSITFQASDGLLSLFFSGAVNEKELGIELFYTDRVGEIRSLQLAASEITSPVVIPNVDATKGVTYRTMFLPEKLAIDTFYTPKTPIQITQIVNVALKKPVTTSDNLNTSLIGSNAVDGIISDPSRWVSTASGDHWIEIDLEQPYAINSFETWNGSSGTVNTAIPEFIFQAEINGEWINMVDVTGNTLANYKTIFPEVTTSKVRFFTKSQTRMFEIAVYSTIRY